MEAEVVTGGGTVHKKAEVLRIVRDGFQVQSVRYRDADGTERTLGGDYFLSSAPLTDLVHQFDPPPPAAVLEAARGLRYRNHVGVKLVSTERRPFRTTGSTSIRRMSGWRGSPTIVISRPR
jgi:hypothetical protein